ncbi:hypothetical protein [Rhizobium sp. 768_B6_N1_8]|jgi:hypothetical protein|uniref:hypothetical protein n=1 Tax=unclassified Rhizobium TaxID=2613769 RepID=UPI003F261435
MSEADKKRILERLTNMRGEILSKIGPREQRYETAVPPEQPYMFLRQRMEKSAKMFPDIPEFLEGPWLITVAFLRVIRFFWR